jgi:hypothetical protein
VLALGADAGSGRGCGKANQAAETAGASLDALQRELDGIDLSAASPEALKAKLGPAVESLSATLGEIKDQASAENIKKALEPMIAKLSQAKQALGQELPSSEELAARLDALEAKFQGNEAVMKVLKPLIDKLRQLLQ